MPALLRCFAHRDISKQKDVHRVGRIHRAKPDFTVWRFCRDMPFRSNSAGCLIEPCCCHQAGFRKLLAPLRYATRPVVGCFTGSKLSDETYTRPTAGQVRLSERQRYYTDCGQPCSLLCADTSETFKWCKKHTGTNKAACVQEPDVSTPQVEAEAASTKEQHHAANPAQGLIYIGCGSAPSRASAKPKPSDTTLEPADLSAANPVNTGIGSDDKPEASPR